MGYGFLSSVIGAVLGLAVGLTLLPWIICTAWSAMYTIGDIHYSFEAATSLLAAGAAVGTVTLAALLACFSTLAATPAQLMRPKAPPVGKRIFLERITPLWRKLSFHYKITLAQPVPLSKAILDDGGRDRRLCCPYRHRLRGAGAPSWGSWRNSLTYCTITLRRWAWLMRSPPWNWKK